MSALPRLKEHSAGFFTGLVLSIQAVTGMPFLLHMIHNLRHWDAWLPFKKRPDQT